MIYCNLKPGAKALPHPKKTMIKVPNASAMHSNNNFGISEALGTPIICCKSQVDILQLQTEEILDRDFKHQTGNRGIFVL